LTYKKSRWHCRQRLFAFMRQQQQSTIMSPLAHYAENRDPRSIRTSFPTFPPPCALRDFSQLGKISKVAPPFFLRRGLAYCGLNLL